MCSGEARGKHIPLSLPEEKSSFGQLINSLPFFFKEDEERLYHAGKGERERWGERERKTTSKIPPTLHDAHQEERRQKPLVLFFACSVISKKKNYKTIKAQRKLVSFCA